MTSSTLATSGPAISESRYRSLDGFAMVGLSVCC